MIKFTFFRKLTFLLVILFPVLTMGQTGHYHYTDAWAKAGLHMDQQRTTDMELTWSIEDFSIIEKVNNGQSMHEIVLPAHLLQNQAGAPNLPGNGYLLAIPNGSKVNVEVVSSREEIIEQVDMEPSPEIPWDTDTDPIRYTPDQSIYQSNAFYPAEPVITGKPSMLRGVQVVRLGITPYQYNPVTRQLKVLRDMKIKVSTTGGDGNYGEERLRSRWWDPILENSLLNPEVLPAVDYGKKVRDQRDNEFEYLIISPNNPEFVQWADSIRRFRNMQGIHTGIVTMGEINAVNALALESYINGIYETWATPPAAILLLGDYGTDMNTTIISPIWNNYCASDNILADVDNDKLPDIVLARITAQNSEQLEVMVNKFINYETNPPVDPYFYAHPITALGWQTERWFQICSETVGGFWKNELGKEPIRINEVYDGNPAVDPWSYAPNTDAVMDYFGPDGLGYITATPGELGDWWGGNANDVNDAINAGAFMLQHRDHGFEAGWGEPSYVSSSINGLHNTELTFVFSINCLTGKYNHSSEVFSEKFHRYTYNGEASGALGLIAASEVSYSFVNDAFVWGIYDYLWQSFMPDYGGSYPETRGILPAFASAYGKIFLEYTGWPYNTNNKEVTYNLFHHHGDAFLNVYTEVPQDLNVVCNEAIISGVPTFEVTADAGSLICLSADAEILAVTEGTGEVQSIELPYIEPGTTVDLVVTKQNYFRYHQQLLCVPPSGPYLINTADNIHNQDGEALICYNDQGMITIELKNVGTAVAEGITTQISCTDPYVTLTDDSEELGSIGIGEILEITDGFAFTVAADIPDQHPVTFEFEATNGTDIWTSTLHLTLQAPDLQQQSFVLEPVGGNGNLIVDAGETWTLTFNVMNEGHAATPAILSSLDVLNEGVVIYNNAFEADPLAADSMLTTTFRFEVAGTVAAGEVLKLVNHHDAEAYGIVDTVFIRVGVNVEDWERGDLAKFAWINDAAAPWTLDREQAFEGNFALRSGDIAESQMSVLTMAWELTQADTLRFSRRMATNIDAGVLIFFIDGSEKNRWSGELDWSTVEYPINSGKHTFQWMFLKFAPSNGLEDCAWIDLIELPAGVFTTGWAGFDQDVCNFNEVTLEGTATNAASVLWSTTDNGTFEDAESLVTAYFPGSEAQSNGYFEVTLTVTGIDGVVTSDNQTYTLLPLPGAGTLIAVADTIYSVSTPTTLFTGGTVEGATAYVWAVVPESAGTITEDGITATVTWNPEYSGSVTIGYSGSNDCGIGTPAEQTFQVFNSSGIHQNDLDSRVQLYPNPNTGNFHVKAAFDQPSRVKLLLMDASGRIIWQSDLTGQQQMDVVCSPDHLSPGLYQLWISTDEQRTVRKLIVQ